MRKRLALHSEEHRRTWAIGHAGRRRLLLDIADGYDQTRKSERCARLYREPMQPVPGWQPWNERATGVAQGRRIIRMKTTLASLSASLMVASGAQAQETRTSQAQAARAVTDDEVASFALVALVINQVANDGSLTQQQRQAAVVQASQRNGLTPQRFSQIEAASQKDAALQQRIRAAAQAHIEAVRRHRRR